jgi:putative membrane protein
MNRRHLVVGLAGLSVTSAAFAQTGTTSGGNGSLGQAEQQWLQQTMTAGSVALQSSELALQKAEDEDVKQFATFEVDEQKGLAEVLRSMMDPAGTASATPAQPDQKHAAMMQRLQQARGEMFDREYVQAQLQGHQELLQLQESFIRSGSNNREATNVAKLAAGRIREHVAVLENLLS